MAFAYARLKEIAFLTNSAAAVVTNGAGAKTYIRVIIIHNTNTTAETVQLWCVPDSGGSVGTAADGNRFFNRSLAAGETYTYEIEIPGMLMTDTNDTIQGASTTTSKVTIQIYGGAE